MKVKLLLAAALLMGAPASAVGPTGPVTFTIDKSDYGSPGQWYVSGAITDNGNCCVAALHIGRGRSSSVYIEDDLIGADGTLTLKYNAHMYAKPLGDGAATMHGSWEILGGTGAYEGSIGRGHFTGTFNGAIGEMHGTYEGTISLTELRRGSGPS